MTLTHALPTGCSQPFGGHRRRSSVPSARAETQRGARPAEAREGFPEEGPRMLCQGKEAGDKGDPQRASTGKGTKRANTARQFLSRGQGPDCSQQQR